MIWGITLEPGQAYTEVIEDEVHLSMATMESRGCIGSKADNFSHVVIKTGTAEYLLCTLVNGITYQQCLDLKLMPSDKVTFSVQGTNVVYLTGYSFVTSEADQEITETEDWIEDPMLEDVPQDNIEYSGDDSRFLPSDETVQRQHPNTGEEDNSTDLSDREQYSVQYEVPAAEQQYQHLPERGHHQTTLGVPSRSSHGQPQQHPPRDTDGSSFIIKEEIHTIVDTEEDTPPDQTNEEIHNQSRNQTIHQPSTSTGQYGSSGVGSSSLSLGHLTNTSVASDIWKINDGDGRNSEASNENNLSLSSYTRGKLKERLRDSSDLNTATKVISSASATTSQSGNTLRTDRINTGNNPHRVNLKPSYPTSSQKTSVLYSSAITAESVGSIPAQRYGSIPAQRYGSIPPQRYNQDKNHLREKRHQCRFCGQAFLLSHMVKQHERIHTGEKPYSCKYCPKNFRVLDSLKKHERTHTGERPYVCNLCGKSYKQNSHLRSHERNHHNLVCNRSKVVSSSLIDHSKTEYSLSTPF